jgi:hypothetical protein|nr:MAG TPA: Protein of unknown function (DUF1642) [Caudoviricetes sp.]
MNKQELIEKYKNILDKSSVFCSRKYLWVFDDLEQLDEPEEVTIPQVVADWIENCKRGLSLRQAISQVHVSIEVDDWLMEVDADGNFVNQETFARAWLDGYKVEEEKRYVVTLKNGQPLVKSQSGSALYFSQDITAGNYKVTRKELEEAGFGWVFDCPGIEIEEVK